MTLTSLATSLAACGSATFHRSDKRAGVTDEQLAGDAQGGSPSGCMSLGHPTQSPGQYHGPGQYPGSGGDFDKGGQDVVIVPSKGDEPPPPPPRYPCDGGKDQRPCPSKSPCDGGDVYRPIDQDDDYAPTPYPSQQPIDPSACGHHGKYCDDGGPGQWPGQTTSGNPYDHGEVTACLDAYRRAGYDTRGQWDIDVREIKSVSVLSDSVVSDFGTAHSIVIVKSLSVLGSVHFELVNPNAIYCVKSNVAILEDVYVTSCHQNNVYWGKDVNVLSRFSGRVVDCR